MSSADVNPLVVDALTRLHELDEDTRAEVLFNATAAERRSAVMRNHALAEADLGKAWALLRATETLRPFWPKGGTMRDALMAAHDRSPAAYDQAVEHLRQGGWTTSELGLPDF